MINVERDILFRARLSFQGSNIIFALENATHCGNALRKQGVFVTTAGQNLNRGLLRSKANIAFVHTCALRSGVQKMNGVKATHFGIGQNVNVYGVKKLCGYLLIE